MQWYDANGVSTGPEVIAHVYVKDAQESPQIGMDAEGHFVVAWQSINQESTDPDGGTWGVFGRQFTHQKVPLTDEEFRINEEIAGLQRLVGLGVDAEGNFVVAYESTAPENTDGISTDIYRREFFPDGSPNGSENVVNTWTGGPQTLPVVARAATGNYGIFWSGQGFSHIDGVHGRLYDVSLIDDPGQPSRVPLGGQFLVSPTLGFEFGSPAVAVDDDGSFTIAFETFEEDGSGFGIFTERLTASGLPEPGSRGQVNSTVLDDQSAPAIASDGSGNVLIVWQSKDGSGLGIFGQWLDVNGEKIGTEFQLNAYQDGDQTNPDVAIDEEGRAIVAWQSAGQDGSGLGIFYVILDAVGDQTPSSEQQANETAAGDQLAPRVAAAARDNHAANNQFVIAWQGPGPVAEGEEEAETSMDIYARRLDALGAPAGGEFVVNSIAEKDQILPDVGLDANGNAFFVWQAEGQTGSGSDVYARRMTAAGGLLGADELVNTTTTRPQRLPSVAVDADGNALVAWQSQHQDGYSWGIYRQGFAASGARAGEEVIVNHRVEGPQTAPAVASNSDGQGIVAWLGNSATHQPSIFGHLFDLPATEVAGEFLLTSYVGLEDSAPAAAMNAARESVVAWESYAEVEDGRSGLGVFAQLLDAQGLPLGGRFLVNENITLGNQGAPAVARAPGGEFVIAWESEVEDGSYDIFARHYGADGLPTNDIFQVNPASVPGDQKAPAVAIGPDGRFVIVWQSASADGSTDILAQRYLPGGSADGSAFPVNHKTDLDQYDPAIAMNASGQFVVAWVSNHPAADPETMEADGEKSIFVQWFNAAGQATGDEVLVHKYVKDAQEAPAVGIDAAGRFVVAWQSINQDGNSWGVFGRRFEADKTPIDRREFVVNETRMGPQRFAGLGVDEYGRFVIAWQSNERAELTDTGSGGGGGGGEPGGPEGSSWDLYSRQYSWDGSPEGGELPVNVWQMGPQILPVVAQAPGGDFGIFWLGQGPDHVEGVHGRLYRSLFEFCDAPDPSYPTLLASNGARHLPFSPLYLGAGMDAEFDGQPSVGATGDDIDACGDDEDGVTLPGLLISGVNGTFTVTASAAGKLDAWIDFNRNGSFEPAEQIAASLDVVPGANAITATIPATVNAGTTYARFRLSSHGGLAPTGVALDGEVEDYAVRIVGQNVATLMDDPQNPGHSMLLVVGTNSNNTLTIDPVGSNLRVRSSGRVLGDFPAAAVSRMVVYGLAGNDTIRLNANLNIPAELYGGAGNDALTGGAAADLLYGEDGNDRLNGNGGNDSLFGGNGRDYLAGGAGDDGLWGGADNDTLYGDNGQDRLFGEAGSDTLRGGRGDDELWGGADNDRLYGEDGNDALWGEAGNDTLSGGGGDDRLLGGDGADRLTGDAGVDILQGGADNDNLSGGTGRDLLLGGLGSDRLAGDSDDDILIGASTTLDANEQALAAILAEWRSNTPFLTRIANLASALNAQTVVGDGLRDDVYGSSGRDWMLDYELLDAFRDYSSNATFGDAKN